MVPSVHLRQEISHYRLLAWHDNCFRKRTFRSSLSNSSIRLAKRALKVVAQDGKPLPAEHLISSVNLRVEAQGTEMGDTFRLLAMRKLEDLPLV